MNPGRGKTTGPVHIHRITDSMVAAAPHLRDVAGDIEERLSGAALVAHNAPFEAGFLFKGFTGIGRPLPQLPALDTLRLARRTHLPVANHRLTTLASWAGSNWSTPTPRRPTPQPRPGCCRCCSARPG